MADYAATGLPPAYLPKHDLSAPLHEIADGSDDDQPQNDSATDDTNLHPEDDR
jgi:hypothetical protein